VLAGLGCVASIVYSGDGAEDRDAQDCYRIPDPEYSQNHDETGEEDAFAEDHSKDLVEEAVFAHVRLLG
jgi:hypothetical protein